MSAWHIHRYDGDGDGISIAAQDIASEEEALRMALKLAREDAPAKVMRIDRTGENEIIAVFEVKQ
jgi:hypothetical protein